MRQKKPAAGSCGRHAITGEVPPTIYFGEEMVTTELYF